MGTELERLYYDDRKQKINLIFSIIINLAVLVFFKYYGFLLNTIGGIIGPVKPWEPGVPEVRDRKERPRAKLVTGLSLIHI